MKISVDRVAHSFVRPREPTRFETLCLSAIDLYPGSRDELTQSLHVFKHGQQPAKVIKEGLSKALVSYYPLAGRLVDSEHGEIMAIECNGEGAWFVEAIADCTLEDVSFLDDVPLISTIDLFPAPRPEFKPRDVLISMQVTEFRCGGFVVGFTFIHVVVDGIGAAQFMKAIGDFARGNTTPIINPIWSRHLIPNPPKLLLDPPFEQSHEFKLCSSAFHIPIDYINRIKSEYIKKKASYCTTFEISTATIWQARTRAINIDNPKTPVHACFIANIRHLLASNVLPQGGGYYGNGIHPVMITAMSDFIISAELVDIMMMIQDGKKRLSEEFKKWSNGELKDNPWIFPISYNILYVSDWTNLGFSDVDYGWGKPIHVIPLAADGFIIAEIGRPLVSKRGSRVVLQCVTEEHMLAFQEHMSALVL